MVIHVAPQAIKSNYDKIIAIIVIRFFLKGKEIGIIIIIEP